MIEIDPDDAPRSPCGIHLFPSARDVCPLCLHPSPVGYRAHDQRSGPAARARAQERGQARAAADPSWGQSWTPTAIGAGD